MRRRSRPAVAGFALLLCAAVAAVAYETDQYTHRLEPLADSEPELDRLVNDGLERVVSRWRGPEDRWAFAHDVYNDLGGFFWVDKIERRAMKSPTIDHLPQYRHQSIFTGAPFWATRVNFFFGVGRTIRLAGSLVGSDKLGHFFSQGVKYYRSRLAGWSEPHVVWRGQFNERWIFGQLTTSVYSNADLVANYEGYRFYRSLFENGVVNGKPAMVRFDGRRATLVRPFAWSDFVNDYWDEALNPSYFSPGLARAVRQALLTVCDDYERAPEAFTLRDDPTLRDRYATIGLRAAPENSVPAVCGAAP